MNDLSIEPTVNTEVAGRSLMDEMREHYRDTGEVRAEDIVRIFGDPRQGVFMRGVEESECPQHSNFRR